MQETGRAILSIVASVLALATLSVILSNHAATAKVIGAGGSALANVIGAATAPVTGGAVAVNTGGGMFGSSINQNMLSGLLNDPLSVFGIGSGQ